MKLSAFPHKFPLTGNLLTNNTALLVIDMQVDFAAKGGYIDQMGVDPMLLTHGLSTPPQSIYILTREELESYDLVTE